MKLLNKLNPYKQIEQLRSEKDALETLLAEHELHITILQHHLEAGQCQNKELSDQLASSGEDLKQVQQIQSMIDAQTMQSIKNRSQIYVDNVEHKGKSAVTLIYEAYINGQRDLLEIINPKK